MSIQKVSQQLFMKVKQKLDYHRLPANFPVESAPLLDKLLSMIDNQGATHHFREGANLNQSSLPSALKHQIARVIKQNNQLHMNLMVAKEQNQSLEHRLYKIQANKHSIETELQKYSKAKETREEELINQLRQVKYKYNQLMDFLHQDPKADREYIKRLMKHKKIEIKQTSRESHQQNKIKRDSSGNYDRIHQLQSKILNRENQILRLQKLIEYDGISMNKLIKNFNEDLFKKQLKNADSKINYLENSYDQIKKQNSKIKSNNGSKEALRAEVQKCHNLIDTLKKQNKQLKRNHNEQQFDLKKKKDQNQRNISKVKADKHQAQKIIVSNHQTIRDLNKKNQFLERQLGQIKELYQGALQTISKKQTDNTNLLKKNEENKVFYQYQFQNLKKKIIEIEIELSENKLKLKQVFRQLEISIREGQLKSDSINNLEKIVNQLIRKNGILSDHSLATIDQSLKKSEDLELKRQLIDREQHLIHSQNQRAQLEVNLKTLEHRFGQVAKENERFKFENGQFRDQIQSKQSLIGKLNQQIDEMRFILKREQAEVARLMTLSNENSKHTDTIVADLKMQIERANHHQKSLKLRVKDLQIKISEQQGVWQVTRIRIEEKQKRIQQLQKLLNETIEQKRLQSIQLTQIQQQNHDLNRQKHRLSKKYEQLKKDEDEFKATSFKNYQASISDNLNELNIFKKEIMKLNESNEHLSIRYQQVSNLLNQIRRQKELIEFDKIGLQRQNMILKNKIMECQEIQKAFQIENENLHNLARRI